MLDAPRLPAYLVANVAARLASAYKGTEAARQIIKGYAAFFFPFRPSSRAESFTPVSTNGSSMAPRLPRPAPDSTEARTGRPAGIPRRQRRLSSGLPTKEKRQSTESLQATPLSSFPSGWPG
jgi:hypothetical protein